MRSELQPTLKKVGALRLDGLLPLLRQSSQYQDFVRRARDVHVAAQSLPSLSLDLPEAARPYLIAALQGDWPGPVLIVCGRPEHARFLDEQIRAWSPTPEGIVSFPPPDTLFYDRSPWDRETAHGRVSVLAQLAALQGSGATAGGQGMVVTTSMWALMTKTTPAMALRRATRTITVGTRLPMHEFLRQNVRAGYEYAVVVEEPGTFSHRGSIIDIYPPNLSEPLRLDFFGDELDSMRTFSPASQRSLGELQQATLAPATEALPEWGTAAAAALADIDLRSCNPATRHRLGEQREQLVAGSHFPGIESYLPYLYPRPSTLLDFVPANALVLMDDVVALETAAFGLENQSLGLRAEMVRDGDLPANFAVPYFPWEELKGRLASRRAISLAYGPEEEPSPFKETFVAAPRYAGQLRQALADIAELGARDQRVVLVTRQAERLADLMREQNTYVSPVAEVVQVPEPGHLYLVDGILAEGWAFSPSQLVVMTDAEIFGWVRARRRRPVTQHRIAPETLFADLQEGDWVVHVEYGIGRYHGMTRKTISSLAREYIEIEYAAGDRLYVPIHQADRVSRYVGSDDRPPRQHRLGGREWASVREHAERAVRDIAQELLELYAAREVAPGYAFGPDTAWQHELEASFLYEETDDQLRALSEVKADMEKPKPMDRLLCGDVGYGKTEVALRAAFKAVMDSRQVAVLVPTTVLAQQHFHTFRQRLRAFPVTVEMLSRFRTPREQQEVLESLRSGGADVVIGTHRLLSKDVSFKDLGLLIVDEEQRFGVTHKERLKQMRHEVDVLTMTATPIPRTLYMAMSGIRDMSIIDTPPENRLAIRTQVSEYDEALIRKAVLRELDRGGQVYFVHNRVQDIERIAENLRRIVPEASLVIGHGQMDEGELAQVMLGFAQGEHDILLCTTIIENGLDIPNVNTIIVERADTFGLSQLYQLRGRVGRGMNRAYAYLLYRPPLVDDARKRLQTIQEAAELGAGLRVAMRDMEIRGAGDLLGGEQSGHIAAIGFDLYCRLLQLAVEELQAASGEPMNVIQRARGKAKAQPIALDLGPSIDLPVSAYLPDTVIPEGPLRLRLYRRLARVDSLDEIGELTQELTDRFGQLPDPVSGLLYLLRVRVLAAESGIQAVKGDSSQITLLLPSPLPPGTAERLSARNPGLHARGTHLRMSATGKWKERLIELLGTLGALELVSVD